MMELCSLEEDNCPELFITQSDEEVKVGSPILGEGTDFASCLVSLMPKKKFDVGGDHYEDISVGDDFDIPSSQVDNGRSVKIVLYASVQFVLLRILVIIQLCDGKMFGFREAMEVETAGKKVMECKQIGLSCVMGCV